MPKEESTNRASMQQQFLTVLLPQSSTICGPKPSKARNKKHSGFIWSPVNCWNQKYSAGHNLSSTQLCCMTYGDAATSALHCQVLVSTDYSTHFHLSSFPPHPPSPKNKASHLNPSITDFLCSLACVLYTFAMSFLKGKRSKMLHAAVKR